MQLHDDAGPWTLDRHLTASRTAIAQIAGDPNADTLQPVCHHFSEIDPVDPEHASVERTYAALTPRFVAIGLEFAADRLEAWEQARPTLNWVADRVPALMEAASGAGLLYEGWSWEPRGRKPICATAFEIINNRAD